MNHAAALTAISERYLFPVAGMQGYVNLKGYGEFDAHYRASGWNAWLTFSISPWPPYAAKN